MGWLDSRSHPNPPRDPSHHPRPTSSRPRLGIPAVASMVDLFMRAALDGLGPAELEDAPEKRVASWLFGLGAVGGVARDRGLGPDETLDAQIRFFVDLTGHSRRSAGEVVPAVLAMREHAGWRRLAECGSDAVLGWLAGHDTTGRLREAMASVPGFEVWRGPSIS